MVQKTLKERFIEKVRPDVEKIRDISKKLEKEKDNASLLKQLALLSQNLKKESLACRELSVGFLGEKISYLAKIGDYYLASQFSDILSKKLNDMAGGKPDTGIEPPKPKDEEKRLAAVRKLKVLDTPNEERYDRITAITAKLFKVPITTITLVDANREWHKSTCGLAIKEGTRSSSFCGHTILEDDALIIPDATKDPRFSNNPKVTGKDHIRFYAGMPLFSVDGQKIGTFCLKDTKPKKLTKEEIENFRTLALWAELELNASDIGKTLIDLRKSIIKKLKVS